MNKLLTYIFVLFILTSTRTQNLIGIGTGFDWVEGFDTDPVYTNKDLNLSFSTSRRMLILEARQGFRYLERFETIRYNTYLLIGLTTPKTSFFVFDFCVGGAYSWVNHRNRRKYPHYNSQICPTIKTSFNFRLSTKKRLYLGMDWLISSYTYLHSDRRGNPSLASDITGSVLLSLNYILKNKTDKTQTN